MTANDVLAGDGAMLEKASKRLQRKSNPERSRNAFLISNFMDYPIVEARDWPLLAHRLDPLAVPNGIDNVWMLFAPGQLVHWSVAHQCWTDLIYSAINEDEAPHIQQEELSLLNQMDFEFQAQAGISIDSPYIYNLDIEWPDDDTSAPSA